MRDLSYRQVVKVSSLPTPSAALEGVSVELASDKKLYYCNGSTWVDLTGGGGGGGGTQEVFVQPSAPTVSAGVPYLWFQTGLPSDSMTLWVEDGL